MSETDGASVRRDVTDQEMDVAFSGAALGVNRFFVTIGGSAVRISFAETHPRTGAAYFRAAVTLNPEDAIALYRILQNMMEPFESLLASAEKTDKVE